VGFGAGSERGNRRWPQEDTTVGIFLIGVWVGTLLGVFAASLLRVAGRDDASR
jgi:hypothetical protein